MSKEIIIYYTFSDILYYIFFVTNTKEYLKILFNFSVKFNFILSLVLFRNIRIIIIS